MSTSANTATLFPTGKQEVNRRVAAHLRSKAAPAGEAEASPESRDPSSGAAQSAAREAVRFTHAPSYNEVLADEARAAVRAAQAASRAAQKAQAAAQYVLDGFEAASSAEPELAARPAEPALARANGPQHRPVILEAWSTNWDELALPARVAQSADDVHDSEPAQPVQLTYANLIQFPREMVATRKLRPRLAEGPLAGLEAGPQLSIFEVDPGAISTELAAAVVDVPAAPAWMRQELMRPALPSIEVEAQPQEEIPQEKIPQNEILVELAPQVAPAAALELAPLSRRLLAIVVDCALIAATFLAAAVLATANARELPGPSTVELGAALALLAIGAVYQAFFFTLTKATPGMRYAGIALSAFDGFSPSRAQRCRRFMALLLSVLPLGLGLVWALFDDRQLTWHDRLSKTYLRRR